MYLNVVCLKCGKTIPFQSVTPYSVDKVIEGWNILTDEKTGQYISIRGSEIASICSQDVDKLADDKTVDLASKAAQKGAQGVQKGNGKFSARITRK